MAQRKYILRRPTALRLAFEAVGFKPRKGLGIVKEPAWTVLRGRRLSKGVSRK